MTEGVARLFVSVNSCSKFVNFQRGDYHVRHYAMSYARVWAWFAGVIVESLPIRPFGRQIWAAKYAFGFTTAGRNKIDVLHYSLGHSHCIVGLPDGVFDSADLLF